MTKRTDKSTMALRARMKKQKQEFLTAYETSLALVSSACRKVGISRRTFYNWYSQDEDFKACVDEIDELAKDSVEGQIYKQIKAGNTSMIIFYAKTKMKDRGYTERHEIVGLDVTPDKSEEIDTSNLSDEEREILLKVGQKILDDKGE